MATRLAAYPCTSPCPGARARLVELFISPCVVALPPSDGERPAEEACLVNPANERLQGARFTPREAFQNLPALEGGGAGRYPLVYPEMAVDGLVHEASGSDLAHALAKFPADANGLRVRPGGAVRTPAFGGLKGNFAFIVHAVAPRFDSASWSDLLALAWRSALQESALGGAATVIAPVLGAGGRGAPFSDAALVCARSAVRWQRRASPSSGVTALRLVVQDDDRADCLADCLARESAAVGAP